MALVPRLPLFAGDPPVIRPVIVFLDGVPPATGILRLAVVFLPPGSGAFLPVPWAVAAPVCVFILLGAGSSGADSEKRKCEFHFFIFRFFINYKALKISAFYMQGIQLAVIFLVTLTLLFYLLEL